MANKPQRSSQAIARQSHWIDSLGKLAQHAQVSPESRMRTMVSCDVRAGKSAIYVPPDMAELQPRSLRYLHAFSRLHDLQLVEDRRRVTMVPIKENRNRSTPVISRALSELLQQLGMPAGHRAPSTPHRLAADSPHIPISRLIRMAAYSANQAKRVVVQPNRTLLDILDNKAQDINAYACKLISDDTSTILSHFDAPGFKAIGYSAGKQYVMHLILAGGSMSDSSLWADFHTLTRTDFQFQLFERDYTRDDMGLFHATFYLNLSAAPAPWWLSSWADQRHAMPSEIEPTLPRRVG